jgi:hypothetical protein
MLGIAKGKVRDLTQKKMMMTVSSEIERTVETADLHSVKSVDLESAMSLMKRWTIISKNPILIQVETRYSMKPNLLLCSNLERKAPLQLKEAE